MANSAMTGMEIQAIRSLARTMDDRANEIERLLGTATNQIHNINWRGSDRERFVREWENAHARKLRSVTAGLRNAASEARHKAAEQERVSRAY